MLFDSTRLVCTCGHVLDSTSSSDAVIQAEQHTDAGCLFHGFRAAAYVNVAEERPLNRHERRAALKQARSRKPRRRRQRR